MTTALEVIIDALELLVVQGEEAEIGPGEGRSAIRALNDLMFAWDAEGITLGYTEVSDSGDPVTVAPGAIRGIKANLAIDLAPIYGVQVSPALERKARAGYEACLDLAVQMSESEYPDTLPRGSGNSYPGGPYDDTFYSDQQDTILTETGGSIALEEDTEES